MRLVARGITSLVIRNCAISVSGGEVAALRGPSGSGKTLLLRAIADLDPHEGEVRLGDVARSGVPAPTWRKMVRYVAAEAPWWEDRVAGHFRSPDAVGAMAQELGLPDDCMNWHVARLSTGEKQRLGGGTIPVMIAASSRCARPHCNASSPPSRR
jgi:ABC-type iron transport system FetAB ATPase subunit